LDQSFIGNYLKKTTLHCVRTNSLWKTENNIRSLPLKDFKRFWCWNY